MSVDDLSAADALIGGCVATRTKQQYQGMIRAIQRYYTDALNREFAVPVARADILGLFGWLITRHKDEPPSADTRPASVKDLLESRAAHMRTILVDGVQGIQDDTVLAQLWAPPPEYAHQLWQVSRFRDVWNKIWAECVRQLQGNTKQKIKALVGNMARIAPQRLQPVFQDMLLKHLRQQQDTMQHHLRTGIREISERLLQAMRPLKLDAKSLDRLEHIRRCLQQRLQSAGLAVDADDDTKSNMFSTPSTSKRKADASVGEASAKQAKVAPSSAVAGVSSHALVTAATASADAHGVDEFRRTIAAAASPRTTQGSVNGSPTFYQDTRGQCFCVFFRGLCAAQSTDTFRGDLHVHSALVGPIDDVLRATAYHSVSAFVTVEDQLRAQNTENWRDKQVADRVTELTQKLSADISAASTNTFAVLTQQLHVRPAELPCTPELPQ